MRCNASGLISSESFCALEIVDSDKSVIGHGIINVIGRQFAGQPGMTVEIELEAERTPGRHPQIAESDLCIKKIEVVMQAFARSRPQESLVGLLVVPGLVSGASFHRRDDMHPAESR